MADFSNRFRQLTQRLLDQTQIKDFFNEQEVSDSQNLARQLAEAGDRVSQLSQVVAEAEVLSQLHRTLVNECEALRMEKSSLENHVLDLHQERNEIEPQVLFLRDEFNQIQAQLEQTQNRERNLSDRERQLTEIVAQLERRRAVLNQTIENLTNQEADYIVRTQELAQIIGTREQQAAQMMQTVSHLNVTLDELRTQLEEKQAKLIAMGVEPDPEVTQQLEEAQAVSDEVAESTEEPAPAPAFSTDDPWMRGADSPNGNYPPPPPSEDQQPFEPGPYAPIPSSPFNDNPWG
jgi:chromosome segregation ATPase